MDISIFKSSSPQQNTPPVSPAIAGIEATKTVEQVTADVARAYTPQGDAAQAELTPTGRKRRKYGPRKSVATDTAAGQNGGVPVPGESVGFTLDKLIVEKTTKTILHTIDSAVTRRVQSVAVALKFEPPHAAELARDAGLTQGECDLMAELTGVVFEKHGWLTGYAPEILLGIMIGQYGMRVTFVLKRLEMIARDMKRQRVPSPSPDKNSDNREERQRQD